MANANRGLGKGLGALLGDAALRTDTSDNLYLPISQIEPYANQPRRHFDEEALQDLADSIREHGIVQPLTVRRLSSGYYQIIAGEPGTRGFHEAMARYGVNAGETAMLGDKLLTDTLGARRSGVLMLMVEPRGGAVGAWNHVLHALQQPFKAASAHDERKKH